MGNERLGSGNVKISLDRAIIVAAAENEYALKRSSRINLVGA